MSVDVELPVNFVKHELLEYWMELPTSCSRTIPQVTGASWWSHNVARRGHGGHHYSGSRFPPNVNSVLAVMFCPPVPNPVLLVMEWNTDHLIIAKKLPTMYDSIKFTLPGMVVAMVTLCLEGVEKSHQLKIYRFCSIFHGSLADSDSGNHIYKWFPSCWK